MGRYGYNDLDAAVADMPGCRRVDHSLGIQKMPEGYALMLDTDGVYFFWLDAEGNEGPSDWNMWRVRRDAIARQKHNASASADRPSLAVNLDPSDKREG